MLEILNKCNGCNEVLADEEYEMTDRRDYGNYWVEYDYCCPCCGESIENSHEVGRCAGCENWFPVDELEVIGNEYFCVNCRGENETDK